MDTAHSIIHSISPDGETTHTCKCGATALIWIPFRGWLCALCAIKCGGK
jgi:hypothetical protein